MTSFISKTNSHAPFNILETHPFLELIAEIYGKDGIKCLLKNEEPLEADYVAFPGLNSIQQKSYLELESGQVVEVLHFKDGSKKCIGSFTYLPEACSRDGWATYHFSSDKQWVDLASWQLNESIEIEDWSCDWNSIQNFFYIKTGMKISLLEAMYCFTLRSNQKIESVVQALTQAQNATARATVIEKNMLEILSLLNFFSLDDGALFAGGNLVKEILLGAKCATTADGDWMNAIYVKPTDLANRIQQHRFQEKGPLFVSIDRGSYIVHANQTGQLILIDPHNFERLPGFYAQKIINEFTPLNQILLLTTQDLSGKKETYRDCNIAFGLDNDLDIDQLSALVSQVREQGPLTSKTVFEQITKLANLLRSCDAFFSSDSN